MYRNSQVNVVISFLKKSDFFSSMSEGVQYYFN